MATQPHYVALYCYQSHLSVAKGVIIPSPSPVSPLTTLPPSPPHTLELIINGCTVSMLHDDKRNEADA